MDNKKLLIALMVFMCATSLLVGIFIGLFVGVSYNKEPGNNTQSSGKKHNLDIFGVSYTDYI